MARRKQTTVPADLVHARERFLSWRRTKEPGSRIPIRLWKLAVKLADRHGLCRTASVLKLDYYSLKKQVEQAGGGPDEQAGAFVEVAPTLWPSGGECVIALKDECGTSMQISLKGYAVAELSELAGRLWNAE